MTCDDIRDLITNETREPVVEWTRAERASCIKHMRDCERCAAWVRFVQELYYHTHNLEQCDERRRLIHYLRMSDIRDPEFLAAAGLQFNQVVMEVRAK